MRKRWAMAPLLFLVFLLFIALGGAVVMQLWNWLLPPLLGGPRITFWQALGLLALCRILFGGFGFRGPGRPRFRSRFHQRMAERWERMTPEERERFRHGLRERCSTEPAGSESPGQ